jgi:hypothetical protein
MPRGIPKSGKRAPKGSRKNGVAFRVDMPIAPVVKVTNETDEQIAAKLNERFDILNLMTNSVCDKSVRSMIVSGPPGLGKSFTVEDVTNKYRNRGGRVVIFKGFVRATGLYKLLYQYSRKGDVIVFDDCDSVFLDMDALNLLKAACDTTERRTLNWGAETRMVDDEGTILPNSFDFEGAVIFITNYDFDWAIGREHRLADHFSALISRSHYIDMAMKSQRDYLVRIRQVVDGGMLRKSHQLSQVEQKMIVDFIFTNADKFRELTLRAVLKLADLYKVNRDNWQKIAKHTMFKTER